MAEDGPLPEKYQLQEMSTQNYPKRTEQNVIDSDGTLIITHGNLTGGSRLTKKLSESKEALSQCRFESNGGIRSSSPH